MKIVKMTKEHNEKIKQDERFEFNRSVSGYMYNHEYSLVALEKNEIVGFVYAVKLLGMCSILILAINARKDMQNNGIGKAMLSFLEREAKKNSIKEILLFYEETPRLTKFYTKNGFENGNNMKAMIKNL